MVIATPTCERCGGESACTRQEVHVLHGHICGPCRTQEELKALATEAYLNAEYEVKRLIANRQGLRPDGTPGPKLAQAMTQRDFHLAWLIGGPVTPALGPEVTSRRRIPVLRPACKLLWKLRRMVGI